MIRQLYLKLLTNNVAGTGKGWPWAPGAPGGARAGGRARRPRIPAPPSTQARTCSHVPRAVTDVLIAGEVRTLGLKKHP